MHLGLHLPQLDLDGRGLSASRLNRAAAAARGAGFGSVCANDHVLFARPWLDGPTALAAVVGVTEGLELVTTAAVPALRHPLVLAKALVALDVLSEGRVVAGIGAGSSAADYAAVGIPFEERWQRLDEAAGLLRWALRGGPAPVAAVYYAAPATPLSPAPVRDGGVPVWVASWGSAAGLRRVVRWGDGWLASAYNTDPATFAAARSVLGKDLPAAVVTMWTWVTDDESAAHRVVVDLLAPMLGRDPDEIRDRVCVGSAQRCAELVARYVEAGCDRIHFWPVQDEERQVELIAELAGS